MLKLNVVWNNYLIIWIVIPITTRYIIMIIEFCFCGFCHLCLIFKILKRCFFIVSLFVYSSDLLFFVFMDVVVFYTNYWLRPLPLGASPKQIFESPPPIIELFVRNLWEKNFFWVGGNSDFFFFGGVVCSHPARK